MIYGSYGVTPTRKAAPVPVSSSGQVYDPSTVGRGSYQNFNIVGGVDTTPVYTPPTQNQQIGGTVNQVVSTQPMWKSKPTPSTYGSYGLSAPRQASGMARPSLYRGAFTGEGATRLRELASARALSTFKRRR